MVGLSFANLLHLPIAAGADGVPPVFALLAIMLVGVVLVSLILLRLQQSLLAGYFLCGVAIANSGVMEVFATGTTQLAVSQMSEFGVMLLMFTLGLEFSLGELRYFRKQAFLGGGLQMALCGGAAAVVMWRFGTTSWETVVLVSVAMAMSSTAVSVKSFQDMGLAASPGARMALAVAIFQDLFIIVFLLLLPVLLGGAEVSGAEFMVRFGLPRRARHCLWLVNLGIGKMGISLAAPCGHANSEPRTLHAGSLWLLRRACFCGWPAWSRLGPRCLCGGRRRQRVNL